MVYFIYKNKAIIQQLFRNKYNFPQQIYKKFLSLYLFTLALCVVYINVKYFKKLKKTTNLLAK